jgi:squalene-hopene/tetraprenyl-beta-curcumene cyclase
MKTPILLTFALAVCIAPLVFSADTSTSTTGAASWSPQAAASYMDARLTWWADWPNAARDHGTFCVSCHSVAPYALSRLTLRASLAEKAPSAIEQKLVENVAKRVRVWDEAAPYYPDKPEDPKGVESRGTEAILNALVLTSYDSPSGALSADTRLALDHMWAQQLKSGDAKGAFSWLQFHNQPWEGDSQFYGATLAALAVGSTPASYRNSPEVQTSLGSLREYLTKNRASQTLLDRTILLWASTKIPGLLSPAEQKAIIGEALARQQADGGFSLTDLVAGWKRKDDTPLETKSDGYATGVVALALQEAGVPRDQPQLQRSLTWLAKNQEKSDGRWLAYSMNKQRDLSSDIGRFMSDAATAYAVLALNRAQH